MKKSKIATTIAEAMIVTLVIVLWLTWVYSIYSASIKVTNSVETKIQAIQIAREWIEAITNIRDTNWLLFSSDKTNCWKTMNYDATCIWNSTFTNNIKNAWNYKIYRDSNNLWILEEDILWSAWDDYTTATYKNFYSVWLDNNLLYTQSWATSVLKNNYTRQIKTTYIIPPNWTIDDWIEVKSIVRWVDSITTNAHEIELKTILTNYK